MESCLSCVFDERFIMNFRNMDKETFDAGQIRVNVMDADLGSRNDMIGAFVVDASRIYYRKGHEFYREWVGLIDDTSVGDSGIQGYLKLSISIIGPGDKLVVHDEESDKKLEKEREEVSEMYKRGEVYHPRCSLSSPRPLFLCSSNLTLCHSLASRRRRVSRRPFPPQSKGRMYTSSPPSTGQSTSL